MAVIPKDFHFLIIQLTVDCGIFSSEEISQLDLLHNIHIYGVPSVRLTASELLTLLESDLQMNPKEIVIHSLTDNRQWVTFYISHQYSFHKHATHISFDVKINLANLSAPVLLFL